MSHAKSQKEVGEETLHRIVHAIVDLQFSRLEELTFELDYYQGPFYTM